jgi:putative heme-binding domain-containing protein
VASAVAALPPESAAAGAALLSRIDAERAAEREDFERLAKSLPPGDPSRGHRVFASAKAACTTCHAMAYVGGRVGPDLSKVGGIRTPRDLLEAIVLPSASFVRSYEPVTVVTEDGRAVSGIVRDETPTEIVVQTGAATAERIPRDEVESVEPGSVSLMPKGYDTLLTPQELADLVAFLARAK